MSHRIADTPRKQVGPTWFPQLLNSRAWVRSRPPRSQSSPVHQTPPCPSHNSCLKDSGREVHVHTSCQTGDQTIIFKKNQLSTIPFHINIPLPNNSHKIHINKLFLAHRGQKLIQYKVRLQTKYTQNSRSVGSERFNSAPSSEEFSAGNQAL